MDARLTTRAAAIASLLLASLVHTGSAQPRGSGLIVGRTVDESTGAPAGHAVLTLRSVSSSSTAATGYVGPGAEVSFTATVESDDTGRFVFFDVPNGTYALTASPAYALGLTTGTLSAASRAVGPAFTDHQHPITLADGQRISDVVVRVLRGSAISGRVLDEFGDPLVGVDVEVVRQHAAPSGIQSAIAVSRTDDRGRYRVAGQAAGDYIVLVSSSYVTFGNQMPEFLAVLAGGASATELGSRLSASGSFHAGDAEVQPWGPLARSTPPPKPNERLKVYPTTFCPGTELASSATLISLSPDQERTGADIRVHLVTSVRVSGRLLGPDGPAQNEIVTLRAPGATAITGVSGATDIKGRFTILGVMPGQYILTAGHYILGSRTMLYVTRPITVGSADIDGLDLYVKKQTP